MQLFAWLPVVVGSILLFLLFSWLKSGNLGLIGVYPVIFIICIIFFLIAYVAAILWKGILGQKQTPFSIGSITRTSLVVAAIGIFVLLRISCIQGNNTYRPKGCMRCIGSCDRMFAKVDKELETNLKLCTDECYTSTHRGSCYGRDACAKVTEQYKSCSDRCAEAEDSARAALPYKTREACVSNCFEQYPVKKRSNSILRVFFFDWPKAED